MLVRGKGVEGSVEGSGDYMKDREEVNFGGNSGDEGKGRGRGRRSLTEEAPGPIRSVLAAVLSRVLRLGKEENDQES